MSSYTIRELVIQERRLQNFKLSKYPDTTESERRLRTEVRVFILALDYILEAGKDGKDNED